MDSWYPKLKYKTSALSVMFGGGVFGAFVLDVATYVWRGWTN